MLSRSRPVARQAGLLSRCARRPGITGSASRSATASSIRRGQLLLDCVESAGLLSKSPSARAARRRSLITRLPSVRSVSSWERSCIALGRDQQTLIDAYSAHRGLLSVRNAGRGSSYCPIVASAPGHRHGYAAPSPTSVAGKRAATKRLTAAPTAVTGREPAQLCERRRDDSAVVRPLVSRLHRWDSPTRAMSVGCVDGTTTCVTEP
jgi:hypothetical protein